MNLFKLLFVTLCLVTLSFGTSVEEMNKMFESKKELYKSLESEFIIYPDFDKVKRIEYDEKMFNLLNIEFIKNELDKHPENKKDLFTIFAPYINIYSYYIVKYNYQEVKQIQSCIFLMANVLKSIEVLGYWETLAFLMARNNQFELAFKVYPNILDEFKDDKETFDELKENFNVIKRIAFDYATKTNNQELLNKVKEFN